MVTVVSDQTQCTIVDIEKSEDNDEFYIYMRERVDGRLITPGYLGTRGES
jgi:hypothetical protein